MQVKVKISELSSLLLLSLRYSKAGSIKMWEIIQRVWKIGKSFHNFWTIFENSDHSVQFAVRIMIRQTYAFTKIR